MENHIATPADWQEASRASRASRAERLRLPSGATILAAKPDPLEWILSGRIPQRLLSVALAGGLEPAAAAPAEISREEILDLARFATQLVRASVIQPRIGEAPDEMPMEDIPIEDRAFIFAWACRALGRTSADESSRAKKPHDSPPREFDSKQEDLSSVKLERFRQK